MNSSKISVLNFIFFSDSFSKIYRPKESIRLLILVIKNILSSKDTFFKPLNCNLKIFSVYDKINHLTKKCVMNQLLNSIDLNDNTLSFKSTCFLDILTISKNTLFNKINTITLICLVNGNSFTGIIINRYNIRIKNEVHLIIKSNLFKNTEQEIICIIDFGNMFRYQLPIKEIRNIVNFIIDVKNTRYSIKAHLCIFFERLLCIRGNDGIGILLMDLNCSYLKKKINISTMRSEHSIISISIISKLLMRITCGLESEFNYEKTYRLSFLAKILKQIEIGKECSFSIVFITEIIFLIVKNSKNCEFNLYSCILDFSKKMILKSQQETLPYIFEIFTHLSNHKGETFLNTIIFKLFIGVCNPHVWYNSKSIGSMIGFIKSFVINFPLTNSIEKEFIVLKILKFIIKLHKNISLILLFEMISIFINLPNFYLFLPHCIEFLEFFGNSIKLSGKEDVLLFFLLSNLKKIDCLKLKNIIDKLKINGFIYLIDKMSKKNQNFLLSIENIFLFENKFENKNSEKDFNLKWLLKIIMRNLISIPWEIEKIILCYNKKAIGYSRIKFYEINFFHFKKLKIFLHSLFSSYVY